MKEKKKKEIDRKKKDGQKEGKKQKNENNFRGTRQDMIWYDNGRYDKMMDVTRCLVPQHYVCSAATRIPRRRFQELNI